MIKRSFVLYSRPKCKYRVICETPLAAAKYISQKIKHSSKSVDFIFTIKETTKGSKLSLFTYHFVNDKKLKRIKPNNGGMGLSEIPPVIS